MAGFDQINLTGPPDFNQNKYRGDTGKYLKDLSRWLKAFMEEVDHWAEINEQADNRSFTVLNANDRTTFDTTTVTLPELAEVTGTIIDILEKQGVTN